MSRRDRIAELSSAEALVLPSLLLCDEPTGNLDPANRGHVLDVLVGYADRTGATLVSVTHDHELLARFDRIVDLEQFHGSREDGQ